MTEINLTGTLKTYKAVVLLDWQEVPEGYVSIAGAFVRGHDMQIAIPKELVKNRELFNTLAKQALRCLSISEH